SLQEQEEREKAAVARQQARKAEPAAIARRDELLRAKCAARVHAPMPIEVPLAGGILEVSCPYNTLYMLTGYNVSNGSLVTKSPWNGKSVYYPGYWPGGSQIQLSVSYTADGERDLGTDDWF